MNEDQRTLAIVMALAPKRPRGWLARKRPEPEPPALSEYLAPLEAEAVKFQYVADGEETNLYLAAQTYAQLWQDDAPQPIGEWSYLLNDDADAVVNLHPGTNRSKLLITVQDLQKALEQYASDYVTYKGKHFRWELDIDTTWRLAWATEICQAAFAGRTP